VVYVELRDGGWSQFGLESVCLSLVWVGPCKGPITLYETRDKGRKENRRKSPKLKHVLVPGD
jgi:hypothetical protein